MEIKKIISIILIIVTMITTFSIFNNTSKAATYLIDEADLYSKGEIVCLTYKDSIKVGVEFVVYEKNGVEYPAYCLNRDLPGVTGEGGYNVKVDKLVTNSKIWRAVTNGYPFKSAKQLGCNSDIEAFAATKMAVYDMMYNYDWNDFKGINEQGKRVLDAAIKISERARFLVSSKDSPIVTVKTDDQKWEMDENENQYASKTFYVETNVTSTKYNVKLNKVLAEGVKVTNENNEIKSEFKTGEKFKVLIPISEMDKSGEFEVEVTADMRTFPILYGDSGDSNKQSYALVAGEYEYESTKIKLKYLENTTKIEIVKKDAETEETLAGARFNLLDDKKQYVYTDITTDENGIAVIENINPGRYYVEERMSPDGYSTYTPLIEINVELNQRYVVTVKDYKKPEQEEKQVEDEDKTVVGEKEVNLPQTGF